MNPLDYGQALADFWTLGSKALLEAQEGAARAFTDSMKTAAAAGTPSMLPDLTSETADLARASQALADLWSAATSLSGTFVSKLPPKASRANATVEATFRKMVDPRTWLAGSGGLDDVLNRMVAGPRLADLWDVERRHARILQAWLTLRRCNYAHNAVVLEAWMRAGRRFTDKLARLSGRNQASDGKAMLTLWTETANSALLEAQRSEPFLATQAALIRASTELGMAQRDLAEYYGERLGFPTLTELDDIHRTVTELRRELRALRREVRTAPVPTAGS